MNDPTKTWRPQRHKTWGKLLARKDQPLTCPNDHVIGITVLDIYEDDRKHRPRYVVHQGASIDDDRCSICQQCWRDYSVNALHVTLKINGKTIAIPLI